MSDFEGVFDRASRQVLDRHPRDERGRMLHAPGLRTGGRFYAFAAGGGVAVKLPAERVRRLVASGEGRPLDPRGGRPMREWVLLAPAGGAACAAYLAEARAFVTSLALTPSTNQKA